ncbi:MAG: tannase/feruloyl esterase family alpha/beta hydrolase [Acidobacteriaceae bacterium]|nr:tannase/feruloyl esterase family alpha/beta hydrolase [Acidobacteriaceae bacterium]
MPDSEIHSEVWLPSAEKWNGKLLGTGDGGYSSQLDVRAMRAARLRGYVVTGSDTGHSGSDLKFGVGHPVKIADWAYRAIHVMTQAAKLVLRSYYGRLPEHSYFSGCSTGGQQALSEAQRYPDDYDGIVAGDPGNDRIHLNAGFMWSWRALHDDPGADLSTVELSLLYNAVMRSCDALDGVKDGIITDPRRCHFDPGALLCKDADLNSCLSAAKVKAVRKIYAGARNPRTGEQIFPGWARGSESLPDGSGSWAGYFAGKAEPARIDFWRYWIFDDPHWEPKTFDFDRDIAFADHTLPQVSAVDPDLTAFKRHGGKLLMFQGWADPVVPPENTIHYYDSVEREMGTKTADSFAVLFMVPGMGHCGGGPGPSKFDSLEQIDMWVATDRAPQRIVAEHLDKAGSVDRTRPICRYPQQPVYKGSGSTDDAANFVCRAPASPQLLRK